MSSPCLLRAAPISQPRLREVKISLKASPRESVAVRTSGSGVSTSSRAYVQTLEKDPPALRVSLSSSRSRSTPPVHKSTKKSPRGTVKEPEHHPERNGTLLHVPVSATPLGHSALSSSSSSSSSCTPRRQRDPRPQQHPQTSLYTSSSSSSVSSSARSMKRARWLSYSTSNLNFNSILDGRFRQLQGTGRGALTTPVCVCQFESCSVLRLNFSSHVFHVEDGAGEGSWAVNRFEANGLT